MSTFIGIIWLMIVLIPTPTKWGFFGKLVDLVYAVGAGMFIYKGLFT